MTLPTFTGPGYFGGESPDGLTTVAGVPITARVDVLWRDPADTDAQDVLVQTTQSAADGTWQITNINPELQYVVRGIKPNFDDVTLVGAVPVRSDVLMFEDQLQPTPSFDGVSGHVLLTSGVPAFEVSALSALPSGLTPVMLGRKLVISGSSEDAGNWQPLLRVTASNGVYVDVPLHIKIELQSDPHWNNVIAMLHFEDGMTDDTGRVWTRRGTQANVQASSAQSGTGGLRVDGVDSSIDTAVQLGVTGSTPVTIEGWMRIASYQGPKMPGSNTWRHTFFSQCGGSGSQDQFVFVQEGKIHLYRDAVYTGGSGVINANGASDFPLNSFAHIAYSYDGSRARVFVNGRKEIDIACANGWANTPYPFRLGASMNAGYPQYRAGSNADFDRICITRGVARYIEPFTPRAVPYLR